MLNRRLVILLVLVILGGRVDPQLFSIKVVPSPSVIVRWSESQVLWDSMSNAVNSNDTTSPCSTIIVSVLSRLFEYSPGWLGEVTMPIWQRVFNIELKNILPN